MTVDMNIHEYENIMLELTPCPNDAPWLGSGDWRLIS